MALAEDNDRRVLLKLSSDNFVIDYSDPGLVDSSSLFLRHTEDDPATQGTITPEVMPEDEVVAYNEFFIDRAGREDDIIAITAITAKIKAKNTNTGAEFDLDPFTLPVTDQDFAFSLERIFHIPIAEIRKTIVIERRTDLDTGEKSYYSVNFPFKIRWEYWLKLLTANSAFFDTGEPQNGLNNDWYRIATAVADWEVEYELIVTIDKNGHTLNYSFPTTITIDDYESNADWTQSIKSYDGATELLSGGNKYLMGYKDTKVEAIFTTGSFDINPINYQMNILIEIFEQGGVEGQRRMSSKWVSISDTWFKSDDGSNKVVLDSGFPTINSIRGTVLVDFNLLQKAPKYKITARLYEANGGSLIGQNTTEVFLLIAEDPNPTGTTLPLAASKLRDCCGANSLKVFADIANDDPFKTDNSSVMWWFSDFVETATMILQKWNGSSWDDTTDLNNNDYGTFTDYGDFVNDAGQKFVGYKINWALVLDAFDAGSYRVQLTIGSPLGSSTMLSAEFCLNTFSEIRADKTIRIEYYLNGIMGDNKDDLKVRDFGNLNLYNSLRLPGYFGFPNSKYEKNYTIYENGARKWTKDEQEPEFQMQIKRVPAAIHNLMRTDVAQADVILVTDYNSSNAEQWIQKSVQLTSGYPPDWKILLSKLASVKLTFRAGINNLKKYRD